MKFGDLVVNDWAGRNNPNKVLMIVHHSKMVNCLSLTGKKVQFWNDQHLRLTKVGEVDFTEWKKLITTHKEER